MNTSSRFHVRSPLGVPACAELWVVSWSTPTIRSFRPVIMGSRLANLTVSIFHALVPNWEVVVALTYVRPSTQKSTPLSIVEVFKLFTRLTSLPSHAFRVPRPYFQALVSESYADPSIPGPVLAYGGLQVVNGLLRQDRIF